MPDTVAPIAFDYDLSTNIQRISDLLRDHGKELPDDTYKILSAFNPSPVDRIVSSTEALYAARDKLPPDGIDLCARLAEVARASGWHDLGHTDRGLKIVQAMRRQRGETDIPGTAEDDPKPKDTTGNIVTNIGVPAPPPPSPGDAAALAAPVAAEGDDASATAPAGGPGAP